MNEKDYTEILISVTPLCAEIISDVLMEDIGCEGVVSQDAIMNDKIVVKEDKNLLKAYFKGSPDETKINEVLKDKRELLISSGMKEEDLGSWNVEFNTIKNQDWSTNWKKNWKPQKIGKNIVICPSWETYLPQKDDIVLNLDPGCAFGTGTHETTQLCVFALEKYMSQASIVADIGMGSGILSIIAVKLGAQKAVGVDNDPDVIETAIENARKNDISELCAFHQGTIADVKGQYDFVCANILHNVLIDIMPELYRILKPKGILSLSGILNEKAQSVLDSALSNNLKLIETMVDGDWTGFIVQK